MWTLAGCRTVERDHLWTTERSGVTLANLDKQIGTASLGIVDIKRCEPEVLNDTPRPIEPTVDTLPTVLNQWNHVHKASRPSTQTDLTKCHPARPRSVNDSGDQRQEWYPNKSPPAVGAQRRNEHGEPGDRRHAEHD